MDKTLYNILGIESNATHEDILRAVRKKSLEHHPDRGGSHEMMQQVNAAKAILTDPEERKKYDQYGLKGMKQDMNGGNTEFGGLSGGIFDLFNLLSRAARNRNSRTSKKTDIKHVLKVSLEELYMGSMKIVEIDRCVVCTDCRGTGCRDGIQRECTKCKGKGIEIVINHNGETIQQIQRQCSICNGEGDIINSEDRCDSCHGQKFVQEKKIFNVNITPGSKNGEIIKFYGEGNEIINGQFGTLNIILEQQSHSIFDRDNDDLIMKLQINLSESLCGFQYPIKLLDGRTLLINHYSGKPIITNSYYYIKGYGMLNRETHSYGDLIIHFNVEFPRKGFIISDYQLKQLEAILPSKSNITLIDKESYEKIELLHYQQYQTNSQ